MHQAAVLQIQSRCSSTGAQGLLCRQCPLPLHTEWHTIPVNLHEGLKLAACFLIFKHNEVDLAFQLHYERLLSEQLKRGK